MRISVIIAAAGRGKRFGAKTNKAYVLLNGRPIVMYSLMLFSKLSAVAEIILVVNRRDRGIAAALLKKHHLAKPVKIVFGGKERYQSVQAGLNASDPRAEMIIVHDAARPFIDKKTVVRAIAAAKKYGAACVAVPVVPTIKQADSRGFIVNTLTRKRLWEAQTPQVFKKGLIAAAHQQANKNNITDDAALLERINKKVKIVAGSYRNIKITTPLDLTLAGILASHGKS